MVGVGLGLFFVQVDGWKIPKVDYYHEVQKAKSPGSASSWGFHFAF